MSFFSTVGTYFVIFFREIWHLFLTWISMFIAPTKNFETLWILIPIYLNWIFTEIYQEKRITSFGNAISNGVVVLWVGIDWMRYLVRAYEQTNVNTGFVFYSKIIISTMVLIYGLIIIIYGIKMRKFIHFIGRIREISYVLIMFTPIIYGVIEFNWYNIFTILLFFPIFYLIIEYINYKSPDPKTYEVDEE
jgi:hypothetical protein